MAAIDEYKEALQRLLDNKPINVPLGSKINKDTVALEAGRKRGSIKKSRLGFEQLILDIDAAEEKVSLSIRKYTDRINRLKFEVEELREQLDKSYEESLMLRDALARLQKEQTTRSNVIPLK